MERRPDADLLRFADEHHGLYRTQDALRFGLTRRQIAHRLRQGRAQVMCQGIYRVVGSPATFEQRAQLAVWRTGGVISHRSAAQVHDLMQWSVELIEVSVPRSGAHEIPGVVCHRSGDLARARTSQYAGLPVTDPTRTLMDLGAVVGTRALECMVHSALHRRLTNLEALVAAYSALSKQGRHGAGPIGDILRELDPTLAPAESDLETLLVQILRDHGVPAPVRQHRVNVGGERFRLDFAYPDQMLFLEGDGFGVHGTRTAFEDDRRRQNLLVVAGWRPLRFTWRQLRQQPEVVARTVLVALGRI